MATRKFISRKKKNVRTQKGGSSRRPSIKLPQRGTPPKGFSPRTAFRRPTPNQQQKKRELHISAVKNVVDAAEYLIQAARVKITNPDGITRTSYNNDVIQNFLKKKGHNKNVASSVANLIRDSGISYAAGEYGIEYTKPELASKSKGEQLLGLSKTIRGYHNTLKNTEDKARFINFINEKIKSRTNSITSQNTASLVSEYKKSYGTYAELG